MYLYYMPVYVCIYCIYFNVIMYMLTYVMQRLLKKLIVLQVLVGFINPLHFTFSFKHCKWNESHCKISSFSNLEFFLMCLFMSQLNKQLNIEHAIYFNAIKL